MKQFEMSNGKCVVSDTVCGGAVASGGARWDSIDLLKGMGCIAVVLIHVRFPRPLNEPLRAACRFAVPLFFAVSGFFFARRRTCSLESIARKLRHTLLLALASTVALSALVVIQGWVDPNFSVVGLFKANATAERAAKFLVINAPPPPLVHLWFVWSLVYCYLFCLIWFKNGTRLWTVSPIGAVLLIGMVAFHEFIPRFGSAPLVPLSGVSIRICDIFLFKALPFFLLGMWFRRLEGSILTWHMSPTACVALAVAGGAMAVAEYKVLGVSQFYIGSCLTVAAMFIWAIRNPGDGWKPVVFIGRRLSFLVYVLHVAVWQFLAILLRRFHADSLLIVRWMLPVMVVALSLLVALALNWAWRNVVEKRYP